MVPRRVAAAMFIPFFILAISAPAIAEPVCVFKLLCLEPQAPAPAPVLPSPEAVTQPVVGEVSALVQQALSTPVGVLESQMLTLINADRVAAGVQPLQSVAWAQSVARNFSEAMKAAGTIWHNPDYMSGGRKAMGADMLGENVGYDQSIAMDHLGFMASPHHRDNVLEARYTHVGIGVAVSADGTRVYVTEDFARIPGGAAPAAPKAPVVLSKATAKPATVRVAAAPKVAPVVEIPTIVLPATAGNAEDTSAAPSASVSKATEEHEMTSAGRHGPFGSLMPGLVVGGLVAILSPFVLMGRKMIGLLGALLRG